ncbi:MAG: signal recognition particle protein, partial [Spirochaetales bacterium]|nr:signal recognition particle protein [Spirochaetales bacterium]
VLTKFDSDTRGGAAFSIKQILGKPLKFVGVSEKLDGLEVFHPERIASRILGMGDVVSLVEKAQEVYDEEEAKKLAKKIKRSEFTLQDFLEQMEQMDKVGSIESIMEMLPGGKEAMKNIDMSAFEKQKADLKKKRAIIQAMTMKEREDFRLVMGSRKRRIAKGAGVTVMAVDNLLKTFQKTRTMMKGMLKNKGKYGGMDLSPMLGRKF